MRARTHLVHFHASILPADDVESGNSRAGSTRQRAIVNKTAPGTGFALDESHETYSRQPQSSRTQRAGDPRPPWSVSRHDRPPGARGTARRRTARGRHGVAGPAWPGDGPGDQGRNDSPGAGGQAAHGRTAGAERRGENPAPARGLGMAQLESPAEYIRCSTLSIRAAASPPASARGSRLAMTARLMSSAPIRLTASGGCRRTCRCRPSPRAVVGCR